MNKLDELYQLIQNNINETFDYDRYRDHIMLMIENLHFIGEIDKDNLYIQMLLQVKDCDDNLIMLTPEQAEEFYLTGWIKGLEGFHPQWSLHFFVNMEKKYVRIYTGLKIDQRRSPKDNYGLMYEIVEPKIATKQAGPPMMHEFEIDKDSYRDVWNRLIEIVQFSKTNEIEFGDFDKKIRQDMRKYWGIINNNNFIDDQYKDTQRPELIKVPQKHDVIQLLEDLKVRNLLRGTGYMEVDFENNGNIRDFNTVKDAKDYFYSLIDFINSHNEEFRVTQEIKYLEKHFLSNKWPIPKDETEADKLLEELTYYKTSVQKFKNKIIIQLEVSEYGIYYIITNYWENKFCDNLA